MTTAKSIRLNVLEEITNGFSVGSLIGTGGYANVYKGNYNGELIAVKLLHDDLAQLLDDNRFINEVVNLLRIEHPNIVRLRGYCHETHSKIVEHKGENRLGRRIYKILCFEYLQLGSLDKHLCAQSFAPDWSTRYDIIKGICEGLNFLHGREPPILHLDLKPGNVLLDHYLVPKVADFGLSRVISRSHTAVTKNVIGTRKYMPPEFFKDGEMSTKNDVFSLGVVMIEIMTGSSSYSSDTEMDDVAQFMQQVVANWSSMIEATSEYRLEKLDQVKTCIGLAIQCVDSEKINRPTTADILDALNKTEVNIPKRQKRKFDELKEVALHNDRMSILLPPVGRGMPLPPNIVGQNNYLEEIVACIRQGTTSFIGICGMGGAGKTTLLTQLNNTFSRVAELHEFDHVIYVEVGQQQNLGTVQQSIASQLGLTLGQDESITARSASLYNFLKEKKYLLLMDNLWQPLDLVKVGITQGYGKIDPQNWQMIVITTRDQQICHRMQALNHLIVLQRLNFEHAWSLFEANAGCHSLTNNSAQIKVHAKSIVEKCGGLPLALKIVGQAMASKQSEHDWKLAMILLGKSQYHKVPDADAEINLYDVLYISYNQLPDERTKQCFLLFALLASGAYLYIPYIIDFWMGHGLLDEDDDISINYLRGHSIVGCLKRACLLEEDPRGKNYLMIHDTIRGLVFWIVKNKQGDGPNRNWLHCTGEETVKPEACSTAHRISFWNIRDVVDLGDSCHSLITLVYRSSNLSHVPTGVFRSATSLTYLDLIGSTIRELPSCVGELVNLQYLGLAATPIQSIPMEFQLLKSLRYLNLRNTDHLETIPDGTISALIMLKSLTLYRSGSFPLDKILHIEELESLIWLQSLGFTVRDFVSLQRILDLSKPSLKSLSIEKVEGLPVLHFSPALVSKQRAHQLERLTLRNMDSLKELLIGETIMDSDWSFEVLDELILENIMKLENIIWKGMVPHACLPRLERLVIRECHSIREITWIKQLPCLEVVYLIDCGSMLELVANDAEGLTMSSDGDTFPSLKLLGLSRLPNLQNICDSTLAFPCLQRLLVYRCPKLAKLPSGLLQPEHAPLIISQQNLWDQLCWEDSSVKSTLFPFFRDLPATFQGYPEDVHRALVKGMGDS